AIRNSELVSFDIEAIQYALNKGVKVLNHSWGGLGYNQALYDAIAASGKAGMLHVAAAGNDQTDNDLMPFYPASYNLPNIIAVLATDHNDQKASFSHWGKTSVDLGAPGVNIHSTVPIDLDNDGNPNGYQSNDGTSMASPHVAGACALVWSAAPTLTAAEVKQVILGSVDKLNSLKNLCVSEGRLNLFKALSSIKTQDTIPPIPNPPQWSIPPQATGLRHIVMEAETAIDASGVEYSFECIDNDALNSGWQTEPLYILGDQPAERDLIEPGRTYTFRFKVRDRSENHNETEYSELAETTTASGTDTLPPAPNPSRWKAAPRPIGNSRIGMELIESYDENGAE
ncbi:MAG TPA: S8 family serine peptidase, partial [Anaerohalosphaeraceae bacterium]|nr:S8 family serine peptidase [Anaerohalosphaeraceae bacterium]